MNLKKKAEEEENDPYCRECGSESLGHIENYSNGTEWRCLDCGHQFVSERPYPTVEGCNRD